MTEAGCGYLDVDDGVLIGGDAEHRGFVHCGGKLWRFVHVVHLNCDLTDRKQVKLQSSVWISLHSYTQECFKPVLKSI